VRSLEDTAQTFDVDVEALARLNPTLVTRNAAGQPVLSPNAAGFLLTPVGRADRLSDESMTTAPLAFNVGSGQAFTSLALFGSPSTDNRQQTAAKPQSSAVGAPSSPASEMPQPRLRHVRLHHTLTEPTTIASLASKLGLPTGALAEYNGVTDVGRSLTPGTNILIPGTAYQTKPGETLESIAARHETPAAAIEFLNGPFFAGQTLFIPQPPSRLLAEGVFEARPSVRTTDDGGRKTEAALASGGQKAETSPPASVVGPSSTLGSPFPDYVEMPTWLADWNQYKATEANLRAKYGQKLYPTLQSMPDDLREFYLMSVYWGAKFIGVPWQAVLAIHNTEIVGKGYRPFEQAVSVAAARGPGQITPGYWNGWGSRSAAPFKNFSDIIKGGGNGFHWGMRAEWLRYLRHEVGLDALQSTDADIMYLINNVVGTARGLYKNGVTLDKFPSDPKQWSAANYKTLSDAAMIYNSGSTNRNVRQCAGCAWTVGDYGDNAQRVARALPASPFELLPTEARMRAVRQELYLAYDREYAVSLTEQTMDLLFKANGDRLGDLNTGKSEPTQVAEAIIARNNDGWLKVAERQPDAWPYFENREAMATQRLAAKYLGTLLDKPSLEAIMQRHHNDVKGIEGEMKTRVDAMLVQTARETLERVSPGRTVLNTTLRPLVDEAVQAVFKGDLDPSQPGLDTRLAEARRLMEGKAGLASGPTAKPALPAAPAAPPPAAGPAPNKQPAQPAPAAPTVPPAPGAEQAAKAGPSSAEVQGAMQTLAVKPGVGPTRQAADLSKPGMQAARSVKAPLTTEDGGSASERRTDGGVSPNGATSPNGAKVSPPGAPVQPAAAERFIRLSAQVKTSNNSIQNNIRLFAARAGGRLDEFRTAGTGVKIDWKKLAAADVEAVITLQPGEKLDFVKQFGPFSTGQGYASGPLVGGGSAPGVGACQVATLFKAAAKDVAALKVWNGVKHPTIPGLEDTTAVSIFSGDPRQNLQITNQGTAPIVFRMRVQGDTATLRVETGPAGPQGNGPQSTTRTATLETVSEAQRVSESSVAPAAPAPSTNGAKAAPADPQSLSDRIVAGAGDLVGKYAYGNLRAGPSQGFYVCTDVVNYATHTAGVPIVADYRDPVTVRWVGTHLAWFKGQAVAKMVNTRAREFKPAATLPEAGWVIFIRREPYREASHEGVVQRVEVQGDTARVTTLEALGAFKGDPYNKANNVQPATYTYRRGADGTWQQTGLNRTNHIVGYGVVKG
ncbi:MAG: VanW family protein, partial [Anaerolineae bacterium]|nr:VanW family protein [Anaerolineae bacterium]